MSDDELRALERALEKTGAVSDRLAYARALERVGRKDDALAVLLKDCQSPEVRREVGKWPTWCSRNGLGTGWVDARPVESAPRIAWRRTLLAPDVPWVALQLLSSPLGLVVTIRRFRSTIEDDLAVLVDPELGEIRTIWSRPRTAAPLGLADHELVDIRVDSSFVRDLVTGAEEEVAFPSSWQLDPLTSAVAGKLVIAAGQGGLQAFELDREALRFVPTWLVPKESVAWEKRGYLPACLSVVGGKVFDSTGGRTGARSTVRDAGTGEELLHTEVGRASADNAPHDARVDGREWTAFFAFGEARAQRFEVAMHDRGGITPRGTADFSGFVDRTAAVRDMLYLTVIPPVIAPEPPLKLHGMRSDGRLRWSLDLPYFSVVLLAPGWRRLFVVADGQEVICLEEAPPSGPPS